MKTSNILLIVLAVLFVTTFLFETIPVPVEQLGLQNDDKFDYGGLYWTSGLYQLDVGNYNGMLGYLSMFLILTGDVFLIKKYNWIN